MNQNSVQEEIKCRLKSGNVCYHSVQNLLSYLWLRYKVIREWRKLHNEELND